MLDIFIVDCPFCKTKVTAHQTGHAVRRSRRAGEPFGEKLVVGSCDRCKNLLAGYATQIDFTDFDEKKDRFEEDFDSHSTRASRNH
jgi:hypothetical protein